MNPSIEVEVRSSRNDPVLKTISVKLAQIGFHVKSVANLNGLILQND